MSPSNLEPKLGSGRNGRRFIFGAIVLLPLVPPRNPAPPCGITE